MRHQQILARHCLHQWGIALQSASVCAQWFQILLWRSDRLLGSEGSEKQPSVDRRRACFHTPKKNSVCVTSLKQETTKNDHALASFICTPWISSKIMSIRRLILADRPEILAPSRAICSTASSKFLAKVSKHLAKMTRFIKMQLPTGKDPLLDARFKLIVMTGPASTWTASTNGDVSADNQGTE